MQTVTVWPRETFPAAVVMLADGSLESTVLAFWYAEQARQMPLSGQITLLSALPPSAPEPAARCVAQMIHRLSEHYPELTVRQLIVASGPAYSLASASALWQHAAQLLRVVRSASLLGNTFLLPLYREDLHLPGVPAPSELLNTTASLVTALTGHAFHLLAPFQAVPKRVLVEIGNQLGVELAQTFDCEEPLGQEPCLICQRCIERSEALMGATLSQSQQGGVDGY